MNDQNRPEKKLKFINFSGYYFYFLSSIISTDY
jgi:hypothetical protein